MGLLTDPWTCKEITDVVNRQFWLSSIGFVDYMSAALGIGRFNLLRAAESKLNRKKRKQTGNQKLSLDLNLKLGT